MSKTYIPPQLILPVGERDHSEGPREAGIVLVEFGDYQCPFCGAAYPSVKRIQKELAKGLRFVFRNFPITNSHPFAEWAAEIAEAAASQGKFWQMHDFLYENQGLLGDETPFKKQEERLGLDVARIEREVSRRTFLPHIEEDFMSGVRSGVNGTPTFFINGLRYDGPAEFTDMVSALRQAATAHGSRKG